MAIAEAGRVRVHAVLRAGQFLRVPIGIFDALFPGWLGWLTPAVGPPFMWAAHRVWTRGIDGITARG